MGEVRLTLGIFCADLTCSSTDVWSSTLPLDDYLHVSLTSFKRSVFLVTLSAYMLFQLGGSLGRDLPSLLSCRLLTGIFGASRK